ncbi:TIGR03757 family integrating conjugative element protein [Kosakonia cowanii]|nr:TIGR03757 family integrating conjugative element protein [Kosakonia cowanii]
MSKFIRPFSLPGGASLLLIASACSLTGLLSVATATAGETTVFTDRTIRLTSVGDANFVRLDAPAAIEARLATDLPANPEKARELIHQRLEQGGDDLQAELSSAYRGVADAWSLGVTTLPAVVVDRRFVIYGEPDVSRAVARIEEYSRRAAQ